MLDQRIERLERALSAQDHEGWLDAILSLKTSSAVAGALALADLAARLEEDAKHPPSASWATWCAAACRAESMRLLRGVAAETARQLRIFLRQFGATAGSPI